MSMVAENSCYGNVCLPKVMEGEMLAVSALIKSLDGKTRLNRAVTMGNQGKKIILDQLEGK